MADKIRRTIPAPVKALIEATINARQSISYHSGHSAGISNIK